MYHRTRQQFTGLVVLVGALLLVPLLPVHAQLPTPPAPPREPGYQMGQSPLPLLPGAQPEDRSGDTVNAVPACAPWSKLTFAAYHGSSWDVYTANGDGSGQTQLTDRDKPDTAPKLNRGCTRIVYQSLRGDEYQVYTMNADGSGPIGLTASANNGVPGWSPDGTRIAFESDRDGNGEVYVMNADGTGQTRLTTNVTYDGMPAWSPDDARIAFVSNRTGLYEVWVMNADGTGQTQVTGGVPYAQYPCWSPDGTQIAFSNDDNGDGFMDVDVVNASGGAVTFVAGHTNSVDYWYPAWSPDGEWIAYGRTELIYYNGNWYWTRSDIYASGAPGYFHAQTVLVATGRDWRPHWGTLDAQPPTSEILNLPMYTGLLDLIQWSGQDIGPSGLDGYDVQYRDGASGPWIDWLVNVRGISDSFPGVAGHTYYFRCRARDRAGNVEPYPSVGPYPHSIFYTYRLSGRVSDSRDTPVTHVAMGVSPPSLLPVTTGSTDSYNAYLTGTDVHTIAASKTNYAALSSMTLRAAQVLQPAIFYLPSMDDQVQNGGFEEGGSTPSDWLCQGALAPTVTSSIKHTGNNAIRLGPTQPSSFGPTLNLSSGSRGLNYPRLALEQRGIIHAVWSASYGNGYADIYYAKRSSDGAWSTAQNISNTTDESQLPELAIDNNGVVHVVWYDRSPGKWDVYYAQRRMDGIWSSAQNISQNTGDSFAPNLAVDGNDQVHVVWYDNTPGNYDIYYACRDRNGVWSSPQNLSNNSGDSFAPKLAVDRIGMLHVVWNDRTPIPGDAFYIRRSLDGTWSKPRNISYNLGTSSGAGLVVDEDRIVHIVWQDDIDGDNDIYYVQRTPDDSWSTVQNVSNNPGYSTEPQLAIDSSRNVQLVWSESVTGPSGDRDIYYARREQASITWSSPANLSNSVQSCFFPRLAVDGYGSVCVVWAEDSIRYAKKPPDGSWSSAQSIPDSGHSGLPPHVVMEKNGVAHIVWSAGDAYYAGPTPAEQTSDSLIAQVVPIPSAALAPTLSFLYQLEGGASATNSTGLDVKISSSVSVTTVFSANANTDGWTHGWADMTPWAGQTITLTFNVHNEAGAPRTWAYLDEVSLGSAYPNLWVSKTSSTAPPGGGPVRYTLTYGNLGGVPAQTVRLTDTLPAGVTFVAASPAPTSTAPLVWEVGDLAAGAGPFTIIVTATVDAGVPTWTTLANTVTIGAATPEADLDNNSATAQTFVGYRGYLPLSLKGW